MNFSTLKNLGKTLGTVAARGRHPQCIGPPSPWRGGCLSGGTTRVSGHRVLLYAIEGALLDVHWNDIPQERKEALNRQLDAGAPLQKNN